jgi:thiol-disulfide isomerase/thioredoxin
VKAFAAAAIAAGLIGIITPAAAQDGPTLRSVLASGDWLNGRLCEPDVRGRVVLVDFYTFDCINCKHVEPNLRRLYAQTPRRDLVIVSVHSPETPFERDREHLKTSMSEQGVAWPVVIDNDFTVWNAYGVSAWPTQLIFDRHGVLRQTIVGEGQDDLVNSTVKRLISS